MPIVAHLRVVLNVPRSAGISALCMHLWHFKQIYRQVCACDVSNSHTGEEAKMTSQFATDFMQAPGAQVPPGQEPGGAGALCSRAEGL